MGSVPIIDVSALGGSGAEKQSVAEQISAACEQIGFLCISGHGVPASAIAGVRTAAMDFFNRPEDEKLGIVRQPPSYRGYIPLGSEGLARSLGQANAAADYKEAFSMGPVDVPADAYYRSAGAAPHFAPNRWPEQPASFRPAFETYYREVGALANRLLGGFALALGLDEDWFAGKVDRHISNVRALHYPAQPSALAPGQIRAGEHSDYGCLTILLTEAGKAGLEVRTKDGRWEPVPHVADSFVVNIGDLMAQWSNDRYVSTLHRVVNPPEAGNTGRLSIAFFHQPNYDARIDCIPGCATPGRPPRYAPITSGEHRLMKVQRANAPAMA